jgi:predicted nucleic acid-binding protein
MTMAGNVLDASVYVAALVPAEVHHAVARALMAKAPADIPFLVPSVFSLEVVAALVRRGTTQHQIANVEVAMSTGRYLSIPLDASLLAVALDVAKRSALRAYDAVYAALALQRDATLLTLDDDLAVRFRKAFPSAKVLAEP